MRPPRPPTLIFPNHQPLSTPLAPFKRTPHRQLRPSSTAPPPSLLKTHNIPAPHLGHIRVLSLNNPRTRNAISRQLLSELSAEIDAVKKEAEDEFAARREKAEEGEDEDESGGGRETGGVTGAGTRVLILASEVDDCFCAGADLKERRGMSPEETAHFLHALRRTLCTLSALPIPTISAIASVALGGGFELALATTFRIVASSAAVGLPETRLAVIPGAGGTYRLPRLVGERRALEMMLTGRRVGGSEAGRMGVCERVVEISDSGGGGDGGWTGGREWKRDVRERVFESAVGMAREICEGGPGAVGAVMRAVREGTAEGEGREYEGVMGMGDRDEALVAFGERRKAVFKGR